ncbi:MAG: hypothetical protein U1C71_02530, partial [archaeon]|nr:hypothetical protein [archaeon]
ELIRALFEQFGIIVTEQRVGKLHKKWLSGFCESKQASAKQKDEIISICMNLPEWYREKYKMTFHSDQNEIESTLTFCFIRGKK